MTAAGVTVRSPRTKRATDGGTVGFGVGVVRVAVAGAAVVLGVGEGVAGGCTAGVVTEEDTTGVDGAGEDVIVDEAVAVV